jgi:MYXO-CTERM domain-containing protein
MTTCPYIRTARRLGALFCLAALPALGSAVGCSAPDGTNTGSSSQAVGSVGLVISAVYGAGGNAGALFNSDFVELFNRGTSSISLQGMSVQYGSPTGDFAVVATLPNVTVAPGRYFLVAAGTPDSGTALPTPDLIAAGMALGAASGKVALASVTTALGCGAVRCATPNVVDMVGYGTAGDFEGPAGSAIAALSSTLDGVRKGAGCTDSDVNKDDFDVVTVVAPRNQATTASPCALPADGGVDAADDGANTDGGAEASDAGAVDSATDDGAVDGAVDDGATDGAVDDSAVDDGATDGGTDSGSTDSGTDSGSTDSGPTPPGDGTGLVISALYGGGGNSGAVVNHDFVELFNRSNKDVGTKGLSLQYGSAARDFGSPTADGGPSVDILPLPDMVIPAGAYLLVSLATSNADAGAPIPTPDITGSLSLAATNGKIALANVTTGLGCGATRCNTPAIVDMVGYGTSSDFEGSAAVPVLSAANGAARKAAGCTDTNDNAADFDVAAPAPRNIASARHKCAATTPDGGPQPGDDAGSDDGGIITPPVGDAGHGGGDGVDGGGNPDDGGNSDTGGCNTTGGRGESPLAFVLALLGVALVRRRRAA